MRPTKTHTHDEWNNRKHFFFLNVNFKRNVCECVFVCVCVLAITDIIKYADTVWSIWTSTFEPFFLFLLRLSLSLLLLLLLCLCAFNKQFTLWINQKDITSKEWWKERKRRKKEKKRAHEVVRHKSVLILIGFGFNPLYEMANGQNLPVFRDLNLNRKYFQIKK